MQSNIVTEPAPIVVYGATGHTGRFIVEELLRRGRKPLLSGRDGKRLAEMAERWPGVEWRAATIDDADALDEALRGAAAVINAAGPFLDTAQPLIEAALRAGIHYLDTSAEQRAAQQVFEGFDARARQAGIVIVPSVAFYGAFADLLATVAMGDWDQADAIDVAVGLDGWHPTRGTRLTGERNRYPRWVVEDGRPKTVPDPAPTGTWEFPSPIGTQDTVVLPLSETVSIARHLRSTQIRSHMNLAPLRDLRDLDTPTPVAVDAQGRSAQQFVLDVRLQRQAHTRRATASGHDIYAVSAPLIVEATLRILDGRGPVPGAWSAGEAFDAGDMLQSLAPLHFRVEIQT